MTTAPATCIAFEGIRRIASGALKDVAIAVKSVVDRGESAPVLIFDSVTSQPVELDLRGSVDEVIGRLAGAEVAPPRTADEEAPRGRGRPKLGVVAREVTLLPRHWAWLNGQPGGASVALRRLVDAARAANEDHDRVRRAQEATYRFMTALAGNLPGFTGTCSDYQPPAAAELVLDTATRPVAEAIGDIEQMLLADHVLLQEPGDFAANI